MPKKPPRVHGPPGGMYEPLSADNSSRGSRGSSSSAMDGGNDLLLSGGRSQADRGCNTKVMAVCGLLMVALAGGVGAAVYHAKKHGDTPAPAPARPDLGPGAGPWVSEPAEQHGLSSAALAAAAALVAKEAPERHCFLVVKNGVIVHEQYFGNSSAGDKYESDSLGKQGTALIMAMAATRGLIDLDTPLAHYGVENSNSSWPPHWWEKVTARHLLSQTGGCVTGETSGVKGYPQCYSAPGTNWTYDSEDFIGHLSKLITKATGMPAVEWATKNFAEVLGLGELYAEDTAGTNFAAGGGQRMTCRQHARVGQLLANMGAWPVAADGQEAGGYVDPMWDDGEGVMTAKQLISEELCADITAPQMPNVSKSYGLLTWLGGATADPCAHHTSSAPQLI